MRSPKEMRTIQIDITNACPMSCSNCTRFCGNHKKPFFMNEETFYKAVDSLTGFERRVGIMGGEPTLHPKFENFIRYIFEKHLPKYQLKPLRYPVRNFIAYLRDKNYIWDESLNLRKGPGLWTGTGNKYYEHFELIQDTFSYQLINDHKNDTLHQPLLVSRKDLGIADSEWIEMRDNCWIQNMWSATITPKGAFFCEIAGALDMLFDGPGGWSVEPGWWKRDPKDFGEQLKWCEFCGAALLTKGRLSTDGIDDVSPTLLHMLEKVESPKLKQGRIALLECEKIGETNMPDTRNRYIDSYNERFSTENRSLVPRHLYKHHLKNSAVPFSIAEVLAASGGDWVLLYTGNEPNSEYISDIHQYVFNPGVLYKFDERALLFNVQAIALRGVSGSFEFRDFGNIWHEDKRVDLLEDTTKCTNCPDFDEWLLFAKTHEIMTEQVQYALKKIASDYGIGLGDGWF